VFSAVRACEEPPKAASWARTGGHQENVDQATGRPQLQAFFNEHVVDFVQHPERDKAFGVERLGATILEGPPGCGKSLAVGRLVELLGPPGVALQ
jgi:ATP-dependent 26S proteasome regulatory subunit